MEQETNHLQVSGKKIWFRRKLYGWGWMPVTWQGWAVLAVYAAALAILISATDFQSEREVALFYVLPVVLLTSALIHICYRKGEKPRWQWGKRIEDTEEK